VKLESYSVLSSVAGLDRVATNVEVEPVTVKPGHFIVWRSIFSHFMEVYPLQLRLRKLTRPSQANVIVVQPLFVIIALHVLGLSVKNIVVLVARYKRVVA
jgi:hypothetical protein